MTTRWWEWPLAIVVAPFIIGTLWYKDWSGRRWTKREQARWKR